MYDQTAEMQRRKPSKGLMSVSGKQREKSYHPMADKGRFEDTSMAHVAQGEMIVPEPVLRGNPRLKADIEQSISSYGVDPKNFQISGNPKINPETGQPEFFFKKIFKAFKKVAPIIAPIVLGPAGVGLTGLALGAASAGVGAAAGALDGGGLKGALIGGATGALAGGGAGALTKAAGLTGTAAKAASGALIGGASGSQFGVKGALTGAALGGIGGALSGKGVLGSAGGSGKPNVVDGITLPSRKPTGLLGTLSTKGSAALGNVAADPLKYSNLASSAIKLAGAGAGGTTVNNYAPSNQGISDTTEEEVPTIGGGGEGAPPETSNLDNSRLAGNSYRGSRYRNF